MRTVLDDPPRETSGPSLSLVLGGIATLTLLFGVLSYKRYAESERWVAEGIQMAKDQGATLSDEQCIDHAIKWHDACGEEGANAAVCLQGVKLVTFHCLYATSRTQACIPYQSPQLDPGGKIDPGDWVYMRCMERGNKCKQRRECACAEAYRSLESFCKSGETGVQL